MPPVISGTFNVRAMLRACSLFALLLCASATTLLPHAADAAVIPPTFIQEAEVSWIGGADSGSTKTTASFNVLAGDVLVAFAITEDDGFTTTIAGGSLIWNLEQAVNAADYTDVRIWTAIVDSNKSMTVGFTAAGSGSRVYGGNVLTFRGSDGVGASNKNNVASGAPPFAFPNNWC